MSVSKKLRFEVFKRDGFQCQYCGKQPPEAVLEVDHIIPKSKNGGDGIENLITSCFDCNRGKGAEDLAVAPQGTQNRIDLLKEKERQIRALHEYQEDIRERIHEDLLYLSDVWERLSENGYGFSNYIALRVKNLLRHFSRYHIEDAMELSWGKSYVPRRDKLRYMFGVLWGRRKRGEI